MNTQAQTAVAIPAAAQPAPAANVAAVNAIATTQPAPGEACPQDLTTIDQMVFAIDQAAANEPQTPLQPPTAAVVQSPDYSPADVGNAERFCDLWGEVTRYDVGRGCWMLWSGTLPSPTGPWCPLFTAPLRNSFDPRHRFRGGLDGRWQKTRRPESR